MSNSTPTIKVECRQMTRDDYAKLAPAEIKRRIKSANGRIDRCTDIDAMVGDMFAVQELEAALQIIGG